MESVGLDDKSRQTIFTSISRRKPDALSGVSSARSTPVLSLPSPSPAAYSGPTPIPIQPVQPSPVLTQSPTVPSPVRADAPKARGKPKWMARDLDIFRQEKMANAGGAPVTPTTPQPVTPVAQAPTPVAPVPPASAPPLPQYPPQAQNASSVPTTSARPPVTQAVAASETHGLPSGGMPVDEVMDVDAPPLDDPPTVEDNKPLPYTLPPPPYPPPSTLSWSSLFAQAILASHDHKLSIGDMIRYVSTIYPSLKGHKHAAGAAGSMFNSKIARQTGRASVIVSGVGEEIRMAGVKGSKGAKGKGGPRFVRTGDVYPVTWTLEELEPDSPVSDTAELVEESAPVDAEQVPVEASTTVPVKEDTANDVPNEDTPLPDAPPALPYTLPPSPYSSDQPSKALAVLIQEAILSGTPSKALNSSDIASYIRTVYPFYNSSPSLDDEILFLLAQHFAPKDDGRWSLWIRDGADNDRPLPFVLPPGPRSSSKPERPLSDYVREAIEASKEGALTQRDVAAYVLSVAPYWNGSDESLPFGTVLREGGFEEKGVDVEGRVLWGLKEKEEEVGEDGEAVVEGDTVMAEGSVGGEAVIQDIVGGEPMVDDTAGGEPTVVEDPETTQSPLTPIVPQDQSHSRSSSGRPPKYKGPPKSAAIVESDEEQGQSDLETPISPLTASTALPTPVIEAPPPSVITLPTPAPPPPKPLGRPPKASTSSSTPKPLPFTLPPGPYTSHKPTKTNEDLIIEAFLASPTHQLQKKEIDVYLQTVYPWFRRDERAVLSCKKMVEHMMSRMKGGRLKRLGKGRYELMELDESFTTAPEEIEDEDMNDVAPSLPPPKSTTDSPVLKIRIPARNVSGESSSSKRSAPSASPAREGSPSLPKRVKLIVRDKSGAVSPPTVESNGDAASKTKASSSAPTSAAPSSKADGVHVPEADVADVEMQDGSEVGVAKVPDPPPLPPVSFGEDACVVDVAFGRPGTASFTLHAHPEPEQWKMLEAWRNAARNDDDVSQALCYSLVCYRTEDIHSLKESLGAESWGDAVARTEIPVSLHNQALHSLCLTGNGRTIPFPLSWMAGVASPLFLDLSSYLVLGPNVLTLTHTADLSAFTFAIVVHRPNAHQLRWLDKRREPWRRFQQSAAVQVPQVDHGALIIASKDVSKVDLGRGVPQELLTLSS
ncbi:hypothetical protein PENSPDRAFT_197093 [Peniophora sp. CONT]|nr:hypothetical protein PENSPDRAFT_197093 [Peniophora sp. CONT]